MMTSASTLLDDRRASTPSVPPTAPSPRYVRRAPRRAGRAIRSFVFWLHLAVGVVTGVVVLVMSATGTALAFQRQLLDWSASRHMVAAPAGAARLPLDTLLARARAALPPEQARVMSSMTITRDEATPVKFGLAARRYAYTDPYTGNLLPASQGLQSFLFDMEHWHRAMGMGEGLRGKPGVTVTGAANLAFLFLIVTGFFLWFPRQLSWRAFRAVLLFERGLSGRRRDWNWHHVMGIWAAPVLFFLVLSGVFISYQWPMKLLEGALGGGTAAATPARPARATPAPAPAAREAPREASRAPAAASEPVTPAISLDTVFARAATSTVGWQTVQLRLPRSAEAPITASVATTTAVRPDARVSLSFDAVSGEMTTEPGYAALSPARRLRSWVRGVHTGEVGGAVGQAVAGLVCMAAVVLVWTGVALAWRRFLRAVRRRWREGRVAA